MSTMLERTKSFNKKELISWKPKAGDAIAGPVTESMTLVTFKDTGDQRYRVNVLSEETGLDTAIWCGTVLLDQFKKLNPQPTDVIGVMCWGKPEGKRWMDFTVEIDRHVAFQPFEGPDPVGNGVTPDDGDKVPNYEPPKYPPPPKSEPPK